jgi:hypothetical protein
MRPTESFRLPAIAVAPVLALAAIGCEAPARADRGDAETFDAIVTLLKEKGDPIVLDGDPGSRVLVAPHLQGRILTLRVGEIESTGLVNRAAIAAGEVDPRFNNFGGVDRFWLYPEAGQFGLYFPAGADFSRASWKVPPDLDGGTFPVTTRSDRSVVMKRDVDVESTSGTGFKTTVTREIGVVRGADLPAELGITLPEGVCYAGAYSINAIENRGSQAWRPETGLIGVWILGQFVPSDRTVIIAPFRPGSDAELGPVFHDDYFGKVSVEAPDRLQVLGNAVLFRADSRRVGKFGLSQKRTAGLAGSFDFGRNLLTIVEFDVPAEPARYANSTWVKNQADPFAGDAFQSYNSGVEGKTGDLPAAPFYELESTSPVQPLAPGERITHRHATHHFHGNFAALSGIARKLVGVDLEEVRRLMGL